MDCESGNITIKKTSDNSTFITIVVTDSKIIGSSTTQITINPESLFDGKTEYYFILRI